MKIGIDARMIRATGIGRYSYNLITELSKIDSENQYFIFLKKEDFEYLNVDKSNFQKIEANFHWYGLKEQSEFPRLLRKYKLDLVHFPHFNVPLLYNQKNIITIHDLTLHKFKTIRSTTKDFFSYHLKHTAYKFIIKQAIKKSAQIIVPSKFTKDEIIKEFKIKSNKVRVTYEGVSVLGSSAKDDGILNRAGIVRPFILYVGNAYPHKNLNKLLEAYQFINTGVQLVLVGKKDKFYLRLQDLVPENQKNNIIFTDFVTDSELACLYQNALAYIYPSLNEGFGLPTLEAMSYDLPVLSSNSSCLPEVLEDAAFYFDPNNSKDIATKINLLIDSDSLRENLIKKGREQIKKYSWVKMARETLNMYKNTLK